MQNIFRNKKNHKEHKIFIVLNKYVHACFSPIVCLFICLSNTYLAAKSKKKSDTDHSSIHPTILASSIHFKKKPPDISVNSKVLY